MKMTKIAKNDSEIVHQRKKKPNLNDDKSDKQTR